MGRRAFTGDHDTYIHNVRTYGVHIGVSIGHRSNYIYVVSIETLE